MQGKQAKLAKSMKVANDNRFEGSKVAKRISDLRLESCWPSNCNFRKSEARPVKNRVAYKKCEATDHI